MLPAACIHIVENGIELENKSRRQGAAPFTLVRNLHKIVDTIIDLFYKLGEIELNKFVGFINHRRILISKHFIAFQNKKACISI